MKLEKQVCTLKQAKRLKELGVMQKSVFYHHPKFARPVFGEQVVTQSGKVYKKVHVCNDKQASFAAFTVAELGVMLPSESGEICNSSYYNDHIGAWYCECRNLKDFDGESMPPLLHEEEADTEAQSRAEMLIHLLENNLVTIEDINNRLNQ